MFDIMSYVSTTRAHQSNDADADMASTLVDRYGLKLLVGDHIDVDGHIIGCMPDDQFIVKPMSVNASWLFLVEKELDTYQCWTAYGWNLVNRIIADVNAEMIQINLRTSERNAITHDFVLSRDAKDALSEARKRAVTMSDRISLEFIMAIQNLANFPGTFSVANANRLIIGACEMVQIASPENVFTEAQLRQTLQDFEEAPARSTEHTGHILALHLRTLMNLDHVKFTEQGATAFMKVLNNYIPGASGQSTNATMDEDSPTDTEEV